MVGPSCVRARMRAAYLKHACWGEHARMRGLDGGKKKSGPRVREEFRVIIEDELRAPITSVWYLKFLPRILGGGPSLFLAPLTRNYRGANSVARRSAWICAAASRKSDEEEEVFRKSKRKLRGGTPRVKVLLIVRRKM